MLEEEVVPTNDIFFFLTAPATTEIYTLSLHDALPISLEGGRGGRVRRHAAGVRRPPAGKLSQARRAIPHPHRGRHLAPHVAPERGVPGQRGAGHDEIGRAHV